MKLKQILKQEIFLDGVFDYEGKLLDKEFKISNSEYGIGVDFKDQEGNWYSLIQNYNKILLKHNDLYENGELIYKFKQK